MDRGTLAFVFLSTILLTELSAQSSSTADSDTSTSTWTSTTSVTLLTNSVGSEMTTTLPTKTTRPTTEMTTPPTVPPPELILQRLYCVNSTNLPSTVPASSISLTENYPIVKCGIFCKSQDYPYFFVKGQGDGLNCRCGDLATLDILARLSDSSCSIPCKEGACGGSGATMSVYAETVTTAPTGTTTYDTSTAFTATTETSAQPLKYSYHGCVDSEALQAIPSSKTQTVTLSPAINSVADYCGTFCGTDFIFLQTLIGSRVFCVCHPLSSVVTLSRVDDSLCSVPCIEGEDETCGSSSAFSMFKGRMAELGIADNLLFDSCVFSDIEDDSVFTFNPLLKPKSTPESCAEICRKDMPLSRFFTVRAVVSTQVKCQCLASEKAWSATADADQSCSTKCPGPNQYSFSCGKMGETPVLASMYKLIETVKTTTSSSTFTTTEIASTTSLKTTQTDTSTATGTNQMSTTTAMAPLSTTQTETPSTSVKMTTAPPTTTLQPLDIKNHFCYKMIFVSGALQSTYIDPQVDQNPPEACARFCISKIGVVNSYFMVRKVDSGTQAGKVSCICSTQSNLDTSFIVPTSACTSDCGVTNRLMTCGGPDSAYTVYGDRSTEFTTVSTTMTATPTLSTIQVQTTTAPVTQTTSTATQTETPSAPVTDTTITETPTISTTQRETLSTQVTKTTSPATTTLQPLNIKNHFCYKMTFVSRTLQSTYIDPQVDQNPPEACARFCISSIGVLNSYFMVRKIDAGTQAGKVSCICSTQSNLDISFIIETSKCTFDCGVTNRLLTCGGLDSAYSVYGDRSTEFTIESTTVTATPTLSTIQTQTTTATVTPTPSTATQTQTSSAPVTVTTSTGTTAILSTIQTQTTTTTVTQTRSTATQTETSSAPVTVTTSTGTTTIQPIDIKNHFCYKLTFFTGALQNTYIDPQVEQNPPEACARFCIPSLGVQNSYFMVRKVDVGAQNGTVRCICSTQNNLNQSLILQNSMCTSDCGVTNRLLTCGGPDSAYSTYGDRSTAFTTDSTTASNTPISNTEASSTESGSSMVTTLGSTTSPNSTDATGISSSTTSVSSSTETQTTQPTSTTTAGTANVIPTNTLFALLAIYLSLAILC